MTVGMALSDELVHSRLAASVSLVPQITSVQLARSAAGGNAPPLFPSALSPPRVERLTEALVLVKTRHSLVDSIRSVVHRLAFSPCPELLEVAILSGGAEYLQWMEAATLDLSEAEMNRRRMDGLLDGEDGGPEDDRDAALLHAIYHKKQRVLKRRGKVGNSSKCDKHRLWKKPCPKDCPWRGLSVSALRAQKKQQLLQKAAETVAAAAPLQAAAAAASPPPHLLPAAGAAAAAAAGAAQEEGKEASDGEEEEEEEEEEDDEAVRIKQEEKYAMDDVDSGLSSRPLHLGMLDIPPSVVEQPRAIP